MHKETFGLVKTRKSKKQNKNKTEYLQRYMQICQKWQLSMLGLGEQMFSCSK